MWRLDAGVLNSSTVSVGIRVKRCRDTDVPPKSRRRLLRYSWIAGLPPKPAKHRFVELIAPHDIGPARNSVAVEIIGVDTGKYVSFCNRLQQSHTDYRLRNSRRQERLRMERSVLQIGDAIGGCAKTDNFTIIQNNRYFFIFDCHVSFSQHTLHRKVLQLSSISGFRYCLLAMGLQVQRIFTGLRRD